MARTPARRDTAPAIANAQGGALGGALGDGTLRVPEHDNGVPDILDEARWELEWLLRMQVPQGLPLAGMAHHKVHLDDPFAASLLAGCAAQFCYVDDIQSWSTNELTINWNSALAWVALCAANAAHEQNSCSAAGDR